MGIMAPVHLALVSFLLFPAINGQFDRDLLAKCNNELDTVCLSIETLSEVTYKTDECFPTTGNSSSCYGMIVGQLDQLNQKIDWILYTNDRDGGTGIMIISRPLKPVQFLYYLPESDQYQSGLQNNPLFWTKLEKLFQKVQSVPKWNITSHRYITFTSGFKVIFYNQDEKDKKTRFIESDLLVNPAYFSIKYHGFDLLTNKSRRLFSIELPTNTPGIMETSTPGPSMKGWIIGLIVLIIVSAIVTTVVLTFVARRKKGKDSGSIGEPLPINDSKNPGFTTVKTVDSKELLLTKQ